MTVGVVGAAGRMGSLVCATVAAQADLKLVAEVDPSFTDHRAGGLDRLVAAGADVVVDFTHLEAARSNLEFYADHAIHAVVGTSGFTAADVDHLAPRFRRSNGLIVPNFAIGAVLMIRFAEQAAPWFDTAEIIELHHDAKVDAPSGTAIGTAERMAAARPAWAPDPTTTETIPGARGATGPGGIPIHSVRMRGLTAHQEVVLGAVGQTLTLRHDSFDRESFMPGVVLAVRRVPELSGLTVGLDQVLF
ncbi:MAG: 4-hydroxy-tetrahydrodipicolinate reductase [Acidimicrobiales bacterium]